MKFSKLYESAGECAGETPLPGRTATPSLTSSNDAAVSGCLLETLGEFPIGSKTAHDAVKESARSNTSLFVRPVRRRACGGPAPVCPSDRSTAGEHTAA